MKLVICLISYNRLAYTQRTLKSLLATISVPYYLVAVDNASTDGTQQWLKEQLHNKSINKLILNKKNKYPGAACNAGWDVGLKNFPEATHLMRCDNDRVFYKKGWDQKAIEYFETYTNLGQLGIDTTEVLDKAEERWPSDKEYEYEWHNFDSPTFRSPLRTKKNGLTLLVWPGTVDGLSIIKREIYDNGIRHDETPWHNDGTPTKQEDCKFTTEVLKAGYGAGYITDKFVKHLGADRYSKKYHKYYQTTLKERGYIK
ncbi:MAG TPA: glycosyltransferase family 2 protein [Candidatus Saccharimonadales bacterium]|nr:glycosyltransferase family 2 protein [Candidatus Saccharimonadales bacterium]